MKRKTFTAMFFIGLVSVPLLKLEAVYAQNPAITTITKNGDDVLKASPGIVTTVWGFLSQNLIVIFIGILFLIFGITAVAKRS